jgi:TrkA domain protein
VDVEEELLPGVGLRFGFDIRDGDRIGVIVRRSGDFEIVVYEAADPDRARPAFRLADDEG